MAQKDEGTPTPKEIRERLDKEAGEVEDEPGEKEPPREQPKKRRAAEPSGEAEAVKAAARKKGKAVEAPKEKAEVKEGKPKKGKPAPKAPAKAEAPKPKEEAEMARSAVAVKDSGNKQSDFKKGYVVRYVGKRVSKRKGKEGTILGRIGTGLRIKYKDNTYGSATPGTLQILKKPK